jgi:hypothetical protein
MNSAGSRWQLFLVSSRSVDDDAAALHEEPSITWRIPAKDGWGRGLDYTHSLNPPLQAPRRALESFQLVDCAAQSVLSGPDVVVEDGGEFVAQVERDYLPRLAHLLMEPSGRGVMAQIAVEDRSGPGVLWIVVLNSRADAMPAFVVSLA